MYEQGVRRLEVARGAALPAVRQRRTDIAVSVVRRRLIGVSRWVAGAPAIIASRIEAGGPVIVCGEPGSGKRFVARLIHEAGGLETRPFVEIEPDDLSDAALVALLLDERDAVLPLSARRELEQLSARAVGGTIYVAGGSAVSNDVLDRLIGGERGFQSPPIGRGPEGVRIVLGMEGVPGAGGSVRQGTAPVDSAVLRIPPLRERAEDIGLLAEHFATDLCVRLDKEPRTLAPPVVAALRRHDWPGNVKELRTTVEHMVRRSGPPVLEAAHLPVHLRGRGERPEEAAEIRVDCGVNLHDEVQRYERSLLTAALGRCAGVQTRAAELLGLRVSTLNSKLTAHGIDARSFKVRLRSPR